MQTPCRARSCGVEDLVRVRKHAVCAGRALADELLAVEDGDGSDVRGGVEREDEAHLASE